MRHRDTKREREREREQKMHSKLSQKEGRKALLLRMQTLSLVKIQKTTHTKNLMLSLAVALFAAFGCNFTTGVAFSSSGFSMLLLEPHTGCICLSLSSEGCTGGQGSPREVVSLV